VKIYLAASYGRKKQVARLAKELKIRGFTLVSTWYTEGYPPTVQLQDVSHEELRQIALRDVQELEQAEVLVVISDAPAYVRGGKHFETGFAYRKGIPVVVLGEREHSFHYLPDVRVVSNMRELFRILRELQSHTTKPV